MVFDVENGVLKGYTGDDTEIVIPEGISEIGKCAFKGFKGSKIVIPNGVTIIGEKAFSGCTKIKEATVIAWMPLPTPFESQESEDKE